MGLLKTSGIVLKTTKYGDTSLIVTVLTRDYGKISAMASGVRSKKSRMVAGLQLFAYSELLMYKAKQKNGLYHLDEMTVIESFEGLRTDLLKMAYASYFAEAASAAATEDEFEEEVLRLLLNALYLLEKGEVDYEKIKTVFEWRLAAVAGYAPVVDACANCKNDEGLSLSFKDGTVFCENCVPNLEGTAKLSKVMQRIIEYIVSSDSKKIFAFDAGQDTVNYLSRVSEVYLSCQLECEFNTLSYLKKVKTLG